MLVSDTFDIGDPPTLGNDADDPLDVAWVQNRGTLSLVDDSDGIGSGNALQMASTTQEFLNAQADFVPVSLEVGDSMTLSLDFRVTTAPEDNGTGLRFGLGDGANVTYAFQLGSGESAGGRFTHNRSTGGSGTGGGPSRNLTTTGTAMSIDDTLPHTLSITMTRKSDGIELVAVIDGDHSFSAFDEGATDFPVITSFSRIQLGSGGISNAFRYDNVTVEYSATVNSPVLVSDTFDIGDPPTLGNDAADPLDVAWVQNRGTISLVDDSDGIGSGNAIELAHTPQGFINTYADFRRVPLAVGDSMTLSLDFRVTTAPEDNGTGLRFGLGDGANVTYVFLLGSGESTGGRFMHNRSTGGSGTGGGPNRDLTTTGTAMSIDDTLPHTLSITITRMADGMELVGVVDGDHSFSAFDEGAPDFPVITSFSRIQLGAGGITNDFRYDNVTVEYSTTSTLPFNAVFGSVRSLEVVDSMTTMPFVSLSRAEPGASPYADQPGVAIQSVPSSLDGGAMVRTTQGAIVPGADTSLIFAGATTVDLPSGWGEGIDFNQISGAAWVFWDGTPGTSGLLGGLAETVHWEISGGNWRVRLDELNFAGDEMPAPIADEWVHLAFSYNRATEEFRYYVNGQEAFSDTADSGTDSYFTDFDAQIGDSDRENRPWHGGLGEFGIWNTALTEDDVAAIMDQGPGTAESGLVGYWPITEGSGSTAFDLSGNGLDASIVNAQWLPGRVGFVVAHDTTVYIAYDENAVVPAWLSQGYSLQPDMGVQTDIGAFDIWSRDYKARDFVVLQEAILAHDQNNYWVVLSEDSAEADDPFIGRSGAWRLDPHHWTLTQEAGADPAATMIALLSNFDPARGFRAATTIRVPTMQEAGENSFGFALLGDGEASGLRAEWLPREDGGGSSLQLVDASSGTILTDTTWNGLVPTVIDNDAGVESGAEETIFSAGSQPFSGGEIVVFADNFEDGGEGWTTGSNNEATDQWEIGQPTSGPGDAYDGSNVAATNLSGTYATGGVDDTVAWLRSPVIDLSDSASATLRFHEFMDLDTDEDEDGFFHFGTVSVLDADSLDEIQQLALYSKQDTAWTERVFDLSSFTGDQIVVEFALITDRLDDFVRDGWYIDAVEVTATGIEIASMPEKLAFDGTLNGIATARDEIHDDGDEYLQFTVGDRAVAGNDGVTVFVAWDIRGSGLEPDWLRDSFTLTDHFVEIGQGGDRHRLWAREYGDGDTVTLGGASATGAGTFPSGTNNYFVLFGDARPGLEEFYSLVAEGSHEEGVWSIDFSLTDSNGHVQTISTTTSDSDAAQLGLIARYEESVTAPTWEVFDLTLDFLADLAGFQAWREQNFPDDLDNLGVSGPGASPAGDGVSNLMKYALGLPPMTPASSEDLPQLFGLNSEGNIVLRYSKRTDIDDIEYIPEVSEDLIEWHSDESHMVKFTVDEDGNFEEIEAEGFLSEEATKGFIRLRVEQRD